MNMEYKIRVADKILLEHLETAGAVLIEGAKWCGKTRTAMETAPVLWDAVRHTVDMRGKMGQFILTGSAVPRDNVVEHTGTGRISRMTI